MTGKRQGPMTNHTVQQLTDYFSRYEKKSYKKGQVLIFGGEAPLHAFCLVVGQVRQYDISHQGDELVLDTYRAPAFFPMPHTLSQLPNRYFFEAVTDVELYQAPPDKIAAFLRANPDITFELLCSVYAGVDGLLERMTQLMGGSARSRVLYELVLQYRELRKPGHTTCLLPVNESQIAARCGLSRETVSREIQKLKAVGLLDVSRKGILLKEPAVLEARLGLKL